jgi:group I intron endonuclease
MLGFSYEVPENLRGLGFSTRTYESVRRNRPRVIEWLHQVHAANVRRADARWIVYVAINKINDKLYVGVTGTGLQRRIKSHFRDHRHDGLFSRAIRKYGNDAFAFFIFAVFGDRDRAMLGEQQLIAAILPEYNLTAGGEGTVGYRPTQETLKRLSESHQGQKGHWAGKKLPASLIEKRTVTRRERSGYVGPGRGERRRPDVALNTTIGRWGRAPRQVECVDDGRIFATVRLAAEFYGVGQRHIRAVLSGKTKTNKVRGILFRYVEP